MQPVNNSFHVSCARQSRILEASAGTRWSTEMVHGRTAVEIARCYHHSLTSQPPAALCACAAPPPDEFAIFRIGLLLCPRFRCSNFLLLLSRTFRIIDVVRIRRTCMQGCSDVTEMSIKTCRHVVGILIMYYKSEVKCLTRSLLSQTFAVIAVNAYLPLFTNIIQMKSNSAK